MAHSKELRWWRRGRNNQRVVTIPGPKGTRPGVKAAEKGRADGEAWRAAARGVAETDTTERLTTATSKPSDRRWSTARRQPAAREPVLGPRCFSLPALPMPLMSWADLGARGTGPEHRQAARPPWAQSREEMDAGG